MVRDSEAGASTNGAATRPTVFLSTCAVYGAPTRPVAEDARPDPRTPHARSKLAAEHLLAAHAATGAVGRPIRLDLGTIVTDIREAATTVT